jgi:hypothetical protein
LRCSTATCKVLIRCLQILIFTILRARYEFDDERNRSTPAVRPKGRSARLPSGLWLRTTRSRTDRSYLCIGTRTYE